MIRKQIFVQKEDIAKVLAQVINKKIIIRMVEKEGEIINKIINPNTNKEYVAMELEDILNIVKTMINNTEVLMNTSDNKIKLTNPN